MALRRSGEQRDGAKTKPKPNGGATTGPPLLTEGARLDAAIAENLKALGFLPREEDR